MDDAEEQEVQHGEEWWKGPEHEDDSEISPV
jgi:hypothetical protein